MQGDREVVRQVQPRRDRNLGALSRVRQVQATADGELSKQSESNCHQLRAQGKHLMCLACE
jgi:hypothetical protein